MGFCGKIEKNNVKKQKKLSKTFFVSTVNATNNLTGLY